MSFSLNMGSRKNKNGLIVELDASIYSSYPRTGTTWYDTTGSGGSASLINSTSWNSGNWFDFSASYATIPASKLVTGSGNRTITAWCYLPSTSTSTQWIFSSGLGYNGQALFFGAYSGNYYMGTWGYDYNTYQTFPRNTWLFTALVASSSTLYFYTSSSGNVSTHLAAYTPSYFNTYYASSPNLGSTGNIGNQVYLDQPFTGRVAKFCFYNRALSGAELQAIYNAEKFRYGY